MMNDRDSLRRWLGIFSLALAFGMLVWGQIVLLPHMSGLAFDAYWGVCFALSVASVVFGVLDVRSLLEQVKLQQAVLFQRALRDVRESRPRKIESPHED